MRGPDDKVADIKSMIEAMEGVITRPTLILTRPLLVYY
jgi:hypothetical protein